MLSSYEAFVLHKQFLGETSLKICFFTRESGLLHCYYKGGRIQKKLAILQAFHPLWLAVNERKNTYYLHAVESREPANALVGHALFSGLYINELLYYTLSPLNTEATLFDSYYFILKNLNLATQKHDIECLLRRFEWLLLQQNGYSFSLTCEARTQASIQPNLHYRFLAGSGFLPCQEGIRGSHILALAKGDFGDRSVLNAAKIIMRQAIDHLIGGREIRTRALYKA